jgi:hypothetical protein
MRFLRELHVIELTVLRNAQNLVPKKRQKSPKNDIGFLLKSFIFFSIVLQGVLVFDMFFFQKAPAFNGVSEPPLLRNAPPPQKKQKKTRYHVGRYFKTCPQNAPLSSQLSQLSVASC